MRLQLGLISTLFPSFHRIQNRLHSLRKGTSTRMYECSQSTNPIELLCHLLHPRYFPHWPGSWGWVFTLSRDFSSPSNPSKTQTTSEPEVLQYRLRSVCPTQRKHKISLQEELFKVLPTTDRKGPKTGGARNGMKRCLPFRRATRVSTCQLWHVSEFLK